MEILFFIGLLLLFSWYSNSKQEKKDEQERKEKEEKLILQNHNVIVNKAEALLSQKRYNEALSVFEEAILKKPQSLSNNNLLMGVVLCKFYLKDYQAVIESVKNLDNDPACLCKAISFFKLNDYVQSKKSFKEGIEKKYPQVIQSYNDYFNPSKHKIPYWNSLDENIKILLAKNAKIKYDSTIKILSEDDIELITNCTELDLSCKKETWTWSDWGDGVEGWMIYGEENKYTIDNLEFCKYIPNIQKLNIKGQPILSFEGLENQKNLIEIDASDSWITDIGALRTCINLQNLNLHCANFNTKNKTASDIDLEPIINISIEKLDLTLCRIKSIQTLNYMKDLKELSLFRTQIVSLSQIKDLDKLEILNVAGSENFKLSTDCKLDNLKQLAVSCNPSEKELNAFNLKFPNCKIENNFSTSIEIFNKRPKYDIDDIDLY